MLIEYKRPFSWSVQKREKDPLSSCGISRLLSAAVISKSFREILLTKPDQALTEGYLGEDFLLTYQEKKLVLAIRAENLIDFAKQVSSNQEDMGVDRSESWIPTNQPALVLDAK